MARRIFGYYETEEEAVNVVNGLELKGYKAKNIFIFTNKSKASELRLKTDVNVKSNIPEKGKKSIKDKIINVFTKDPYEQLSPFELLIQIGLSEEETKECLAGIQSGKVLVIIDDEMRLGHIPPVELKSDEGKQAH